MKLKGKAKEEFLRRMKRGRKAAKKRHPTKHKRSTTTHHKRSRKRHHHTATVPMAKRRTHRKHRKHHSKKRHSGHSSGGIRGGLRRLLPTADEAISAGTAGVYGFFEGQASKDKDHLLSKMPVPIASIGRSGTVGVGLWILGALTRRRIVRSMARGVVDVAAYQILRRSSPFGKNGDKDVDFTLAGIQRMPIDTRTPAIIEAHLQSQDDDDDGDD